jgi:hypothetical protein
VVWVSLGLYLRTGTGVRASNGPVSQASELVGMGIDVREPDLSRNPETGISARYCANNRH